MTELDKKQQIDIKNSSDDDNIYEEPDIVEISQPPNDVEILPPSTEPSNDDVKSLSPSPLPRQLQPQQSTVWNSEQLRALDLMDAGYNIFLTGPAGTGKSKLVKEMISRSQTQKIVFGVTASTGIAAIPLNGTTLHGWVSCFVLNFFMCII